MMPSPQLLIIRRVQLAYIFLREVDVRLLTKFALILLVVSDLEILKNQRET